MARKNKKNCRKRQKRKTIVLNIVKNEYEKFLTDKVFCRNLILEHLGSYPELFPVGAAPKNLQLNGSSRVSQKSGYRLKRVIIAGVNYEIRPSWLLSYHRGESADVKWGIFLIRHGVPFWVIALIFGKYAMYWYRLFISFSQNSIVGTTVKKVPIPVDLLVDEEHSRTKGKKSYIGTKQLWPEAKPIQCILHAWIKIRNRATKKLQFSFDIAKEKFWNCYKAVNKKEFSQRVRRLRQWVIKNVEESPMKTKH